MATVNWFAPALQVTGTGAGWDWVSGTIKVALLGSGYTPNLDTHNAWDDVSGNEITGTGYTAGGVALTTRQVLYDGGANRIRYDADNAVWATATFTARYGVVYDDGPATAASKPLLCLVDFGADRSPSGENFTIAWDATDKVNYIDVA